MPRINKASIPHEKGIKQEKDPTIKFTKYGVLIAGAALLVTFFSSIYSMYATRKQLNLAKEQFDSAKNETKRNILAAKIEDQQNGEKYRNDTLRTSRRDLFQITGFARQMEINEKQLKSVTLQARIAKQQLEYQTQLNNQQEYYTRPIFFIYDVTKTDSSYEHDTYGLEFKMQNLGKRVAHVDSTITTAWNKSLRITISQVTITDFDITPDRSYIGILDRVTKSMYYDTETFYISKIFYKDLAYNKQLMFPYYFRWLRNNEGKFNIIGVGAKQRNELDSVTKLKLIYFKKGEL